MEGELKKTSSKAVNLPLKKVSDLLPWKNNAPACRAIVTDHCCSLTRVNLGSRGICKKGLLLIAVGYASYEPSEGYARDLSCIVKGLHSPQTAVGYAS